MNFSFKKNRSPAPSPTDARALQTPAPAAASRLAAQDRPIGELLVQEGFLSQHDVDRALTLQQSEKELSHQPLGRILVNSGKITADDLQQALQHPNLRKNLGSLAVEKGLITRNDLEQVLKRKKTGQFIGEALVEAGLVTRKDIGQLLSAQLNSPKLGEVLTDLKLITEQDLQEALKKQQKSRALGEILCDLKLISPEDLNYVLDKYGKQIGIDEILLGLGYIDENKLHQARTEQRTSKESLSRIFLKKKHISSEQLQSALAKKYNIPFMQLSNFSYTRRDKQELSNLINQKYAERHLVLPISLNNMTLQIAIFKPEQLTVTRELKGLYPHLNFSVAFITEGKFEELFEVLYSRKLSGGMQPETVSDDDINFMEINLDESINDSEDNQATVASLQDIEAEELVNFIVKYGILNNASDIHIEQDRTGAKLRYRIDGILQEPNVEWLKQKLREKVGAIISRIKVMSNLDIAEKRLPQDGVFRINYFDKASNQKFDLDFRVATCRAIVGENVTVRILDSRKANVGIENLGHSTHVLTPFKRLLKSSAGMILVTGPTGSGKSSSLYAALQYVYNPGVKIITAEDPIEYSFPGIMQTQTQIKIGISFSRLLRSFLRLDPDIILVGEMRDAETAQIGFDAAQTGHLLLSTLHTNDSIGAVSRLTDLEIDYSQIASSLLAVMAQRLVRRICPVCKKEYIPGEDEWGLLFDTFPAHLTFYRGAGCDACNFSGYKGRTLLSEIFVIDKEIGLALSRRASDAELKKIAIESGMKTMLDDGLLKLDQTTLGELLRVIPHDMIKTFKTHSHAQEHVNELVDDLFDGSGRQATAQLSSEQFLVRDPADDDTVIEAMAHKYNVINAAFESKTPPADVEEFRDFITDSFNRLRSRFPGSAVEFSIDARNGHARITALPRS